jgi:hypothetical protein
MIDATDPTKSRAGRNRHTNTSSAVSAEDKSNAALLAALEAERTRLMKAESALRCALVAMDYDADFSADEPYYPNVVELARDLLRHSIDQLDSLRLRPMLEELKSASYANPAESGNPHAQENNQVKDGNVTYLY